MATTTTTRGGDRASTPITLCRQGYPGGVGVSGAKGKPGKAQPSQKGQKGEQGSGGLPGDNGVFSKEAALMCAKGRAGDLVSRLVVWWVRWGGKYFQIICC